ncbi:MAG: hypothetical protein ACI9MR_004003 [Myxococcota bacterium]
MTDVAPEAKLLELLGGKWITQAVSTAAALGVPDALMAGSLTDDALATAVGCEPTRLARLTSVLVGLGVLTRDHVGATDRVGLTEMGRALCQDRLGKLAAFVGEPSQWDPWARLRDALEDRENPARTAFERTHGAGLFDYLGAPDPAAVAVSARYDAAVDAFTRQEARALAEAEDFSAGGVLVDLGGGHGTLLTEVLAGWPALSGVLYDLPHVAEASGPRLQEALGARVRAEGGDFHASVPAGASWYVVRHVLHNWGDADATALLARVREAMAPGAKVLVIEGVLLPGDVIDTTRLLDLEMMVLTDEGRERSKPELRRMFGQAGLKMTRSQRLAGFSRLFVGERRGDQR